MGEGEAVLRNAGIWLCDNVQLLTNYINRWVNKGEREREFRAFGIPTMMLTGFAKLKGTGTTVVAPVLYFVQIGLRAVGLLATRGV